MQRITHEGLRKHLEDVAVVGEDETDARRFGTIGSTSESGLLLEDEDGFYISVHSIKKGTCSTEIFHQHRIYDGDTVVILANSKNNYKSAGWFCVDLSEYVSGK